MNAFVDTLRYDDGLERDMWSVFKIMGEFVDGFDTMARVGPCVSIFGSARLREDSCIIGWRSNWPKRSPIWVSA